MRGPHKRKERNELAVARSELLQSGLPWALGDPRSPGLFCMACAGPFLGCSSQQRMHCSLMVWYVLAAAADAIACSLHGCIKVTLCG